MSWAAIWQDGREVPLDGFSVHRGSDEAPLATLSLSLEVAMPAFRRRPVRLWLGRDEGGIEVYAMPGGALRLLFGDVIDVATPGGFIGPGQVLGLRVVLGQTARDNVVDARNADTGVRHVLRPELPVVPRLAHALPRVPGFADMADHAAIATHPVPPGHLPGIESGACVRTPEGPVAVEDLRSGMTILCGDGRRHVVRWTDARERLCLGRGAPVLLRAPYFGIDKDVCVTPETRLVRRGAEVEYLSGTDRVLVRASDLVGSPGACHDRRRPLRRFHHIMLDDPACLMIGRCQIETPFLSEVLAGHDAPSSAARPDAKDTAPSLPLLDRLSARSLVPHRPTAQNFTL